MKFVLEVKESKAATLMGILNDLPYVKIGRVSLIKQRYWKTLKKRLTKLTT